MFTNATHRILRSNVAASILLNAVLDERYHVVDSFRSRLGFVLQLLEFVGRDVGSIKIGIGPDCALEKLVLDNSCRL